MDFIIDPEFQKMWGHLPPKEYGELEEDIIAHGCHMPLIVWNGILLDGHNRFAICEDHGIKYRVEEIDLPDRDAAKLWCFRNQVFRRNILPFMRVEMADKMRPIIEKEALSRMEKGGVVPPGYEGRTNDLIAKEARVGHNTVEKIRVIKADAIAPVVEAARTGAIPIKGAAKIAKIPKKKQPKTVDAMKAVIRQQRQAETGHAFDDHVPPAVVEAFRADGIYDEALQWLKQLQGAITALCGDGKDRRGMQIGKHLNGQELDRKSVV